MTSRSDSDTVGALTRRELVGMSTLAAATATAGCGGTRDQPTPVASPDDTAESDPTTVHSRVDWSWAVGDSNMNRWAQIGNYPRSQSGVFYDPMVYYSPTEQRFVYDLAAGPPEMKDCQQHVTVEEDYTWWNGMTVTAEDYVVLGRIAPYLCCGGPDEVTWEPHLVDTFTYYEQKSATFNQAFNATNLMKSFRTRRDIYRPYLERYQDATTDEEAQAVTRDLTEMKISLEEMMERGFGYGLWKPVEYTSSSITLEKHQDHPKADRTDLERWKWHVVKNAQSFYQAFKQDRFDYGSFGYQQNIQDPPAGVERIVQYPDQLGRKLALSWRNDHLSRLPVRRAINYLIDRQALETIVGTVTALEQQTGGMPDRLVEKWLGQSFLDRLIDYGVESKPQKATATLRSAGYEKRGGVWVDSAGNRMEDLRFIAQTGGDEAVIGDTLSAQLNDFGIENDFTTLESGSFRKVVSAVDGTYDFDLALDQAGAGAPHPSTVWNWSTERVVEAFRKAASVTASEGCGSQSASYEYTADHGPIYQIPLNPAPTAPETVGEAAIDANGRTIEPVKTSNRMRYDLPESEIRNLARRYAWWVNYNAFHVYLHSFDRQLWLDTDNFSLRDDAVIRGTNFGAGPMAHGDVTLE
jgi:peptide/nickel transport system substrate-binding protein